MLRLAEILLEPRPTEAWAQLRQLGVEEATGVLPRGFVDWRAHAPEQPWEFGPLALYRQQIEDAGLRLTGDVSVAIETLEEACPQSTLP